MRASSRRRLITPLTGLAQTYMRAGQLVQATESYERALHVNHVNEGFYNLEQFPVRDGLTESYLGQKDLGQGEFPSGYRSCRSWNTGSARAVPELLPALSKLGGWYERTGQMQSARLVHQDTARLIAASKGENDPALVEPLIAIASSYRLQALQAPGADPMQGPDTLLPMSSVMLRKALSIVDQQPEPDPLQRARVLVEFGDLYLIWGKRNSSAEAYTDAWRTLSGNEDYAGRATSTLPSRCACSGSPAPTGIPGICTQAAPEQQTRARLCGGEICGRCDGPGQLGRGDGIRPGRTAGQERSQRGAPLAVPAAPCRRGSRTDRGTQPAP